MTDTLDAGPVRAPLVDPPREAVPVGTDTWALHAGYATVTPLIASFAEPGEEQTFASEQEALDTLLWPEDF